MASTRRPVALIFDVDGTLADTERDAHRVAFNRAFAEAGLDWQWSVKRYGELLKISGGKERIAHFASAECGMRSAESRELATKLHAAKNRHFAALIDEAKVPLRPGVARLIAEARRERVRLAIATTAHADNVAAILRAALDPDSESWFDVIGAGDVVAAKKPAPDVYLWVLERLGLPPSECVAIEDSENGLRAALAAGIPTLISTNAYTRDQDFSGALRVVEDLSEIDLTQVRRLAAPRP